MTTIEISARLRGRVWRDDDSNRLLAVCDAMGVTACGDDEPRLKEAIDELLNVTFTDLFETGDLERFLEAKGWTPAVPIAGLKPDHVRFKVPWELVYAKAATRQPARAR